VAYHAYTGNFRAFFRQLNPSPSFERVAASEYASVRALLENRSGPADILAPHCFLQGSYRQQTTIYTINDVDIVALCGLWQPGQPGGGPSWSRDDIFATIAAPLLHDGRYRDKVRYSADSTCIKVDLGIRLEILPVVYAAGTNDPSFEPFRLFRPETAAWENGYAHYHQRWLSWKNAGPQTAGNFIPAVKVFKHLSSRFGVGAVSFHIECLLFRLPDALFLGGPADYIPALLEHIATWSASNWYQQVVMTPCQDRDIFVSTEWEFADWARFHELITTLAVVAREALTEIDPERGLDQWQIILGEEFFPRYPLA
jgi:hypothetical protein